MFARSKTLLHNVGVEFSTGEIIRKRREHLHITQEELARKIGLKPSTISLYESGSRKPKLEVLRKISSALDISVAALINIRVPRADLDIALRAKGLTPQDIEQVRNFIQLVKNAGKHS